MNENMIPVLFFGGIVVFGGVLLGFVANTAEVTVGFSDVDCEGPPQNHRYDESEREANGCIRYCETHHVWYGLGSDKDCYWDDE